MALILGRNLPDTFHRRVLAGPGRTAMLRKSQGVWAAITWGEYERRVFGIAQALAHEGVGPGDRVAVLSQTRPEWAFSDIAIMSLGAVTVPIYASVTADDVFYILKDSDAKVVLLEGSLQRDKVEALRTRLPGLKAVVSFDEMPRDSAVPSLAAWTELARQALPDENVAMENWRKLSQAIAPDALATVVYTSGTEGVPKGVCLSHENFLSLMRDVSTVARVGEQDLTLLFLPVAHIIGRLEQMLALACGWVNAYAQSPAALMDNLLEVRPTILFAVPRVFEKIRQGVLDASIERANPIKGWVSSIAIGAGHRLSEIDRGVDKPGGVGVSAADRAKDLLSRMGRKALDRVFFDRVRAQFGGRLRFAVCGGAPLPSEVAEFFHACGVLLLEGYGLTETTGPVALNSPEHFRFGSVGQPLPSAKVAFDKDGEILLKGPMVSAGYFGQAAALSGASFEKGYFRSGDVGLLDSDGYLVITDRKKDLIVTAGGKNIAPLKIENRFKSFPLISHVLVAGEGRNRLSAVLTLNVSEARAFCEREGIPFRSVADLVQDERLHAHLRGVVEKVNAGLAAYEGIANFRVLARDFTIEAGELTPSLKVKRLFCAKKYAELIEEMYS